MQYCLIMSAWIFFLSSRIFYDIMYMLCLTFLISSLFLQPIQVLDGNSLEDNESIHQDGKERYQASYSVFVTADL